MNENIIIAGPCAVESLDQVQKTIAGALELEIDTIRLNLWKPRTTPGFDGVGAAGISWVKEAVHQNLRVAMEVLLPEHAEFLMNEILAIHPQATLLLWIGSRNQNHLVQRDIGSAVAGENRVKLMIKNQPWKSKDHWIGILQHVQSGGAHLEQLLMCHRGHAPSGITQLRNIPDWEMAMEVKKDTGVPMLIDPSHIGGRQDLVQQIALEAAQLPFADGQIIEVHPDPLTAMTDKRQQLDWDQMTELVPLLRIRSRRG